MTSVAELVNSQQVLLERIKQFVTNFKKSPKERLQSAGHIQGRIESLNVLGSEFCDNDKVIRGSSNAQDRQGEYFSGSLYDDFQDLYFEYKGILNDMLLKLTQPPTPPRFGSSDGQGNGSHLNNTSDHLRVNSSIWNNDLPHNDVKLPRIMIPKFSGDYSSWLSFHDMFKSMIHLNVHIPAVQKMHYLKSCLTGEAEQIVRHLNVTDDNYIIAWENLCKRYQNTRALVNNSLKDLLSQTHIQSESAPLIRRLLDSTNECLATLKNLEVKTDNWDPILIFVMVERLPTETRQLWEQKQGVTTSLPKLSELSEFMESRFRTLEALQPSKSYSHKTSYKVSENKTRSYHSTQFNCPLCKAQHALKRCIKFGKMSPKERSHFVSTHSICFNCLGQSHNASNCPSQQSCRFCQKRHNSMLHITETSNHSSSAVNSPISENKPPNISTPSSNVAVNSYFSRENKLVLLATLRIKGLSSSGEPHLLRALIDPGSQSTFVTTRVARVLHLKLHRTSVKVSGLSNTLTAESHSSVQFIIQPHSGKHPNIEIKAVVLNSLTDLLPPKRISMSKWSHIKDLTLADPSLDHPGKIDIILGAEIYAKIIEDGIIHGDPGTPTAQKTSFGWILFGEVNSEIPSNSLTSNTLHNVVVNFCSQIREHDILKRFWELEEVDLPSEMSSENELCERIYAETHSRTSDGRYIVHLPFAPLPQNEIKFGDSREIALKRFKALERRLDANPSLKCEYDKCLEEYLDQGHMEKVPQADIVRSPDTFFYMPHHAVLKAESLTTRTRVVFDASCKTSNGYSLNDRLLCGPALQRDISLLLSEWRQHKIVFTADIARMYRQVLIHQSEKDYQRIIWRQNSNKQPQDYRLLTVTFGVSSAPFLAIRTLHQLVKDEGHNFPVGANILLKNLYVDDVLSGANTLGEAIQAKNEIDSILRLGKFELRKWASNCEGLLADIPESQRSTSSSIILNKENVIKTLGLHWTPSQDCFSYQFNFQSLQSPVTKRIILSEIARIYDPLGWLALVVISSKILMQSLWQRGLGWDEPIPEDLSQRWSQYRTLLSHLRNVRIPRFINTEPNSSIQLHGFCDASERAYAAVLYVRSETDGIVNVHLISAKTKVAPLKSITLPRLELCGAVLLSKLMRKFETFIDTQNISMCAWTDSTIVLSWIRRHPNNFKSFVSNRISEILGNLDSTKWRHVPSPDNPADLASRGISSSKVLEDNIWWKGPCWLSKPETFWPSRFEIFDPEPNNFELKSERAFFTVDSIPDSVEILERFSSLSRLLRVTVLCKTFINKCRGKSSEHSPWITTAELNSARLFWVRHEQQRFFAEEINCIKKEKCIKETSKLRGLIPFLDNVGLLRVGGRLENASLPYNERHPFILHPKSHLTQLVIKNAHILCIHGGPTLTLSILRRTFWVLNGRKVVKLLIQKCIPCFKASCKTQSQLMGALPPPRISITRPFTNVGIDYAGPFHLKISHKRGCRTYKGYIVIFVCLCTKAIHIELVSDLTTDAFMATLKRFIARRGLCKNIYSDCATTFIGARNQLDQDLKNAYTKAARQAADIFTTQGICWHFIPPASPHFGGLWEAGVKSIKSHLKRVAGNVPLSYEEMSTLLAQVEACLNSRPLCPLTDDINDVRVLTPGHFLIGDALLAPPEEDFTSSKLNGIKRWNLIQRLKQEFWKVWSNEYLSRLQQRPKWLRVSDNMKVGDLVLIKHENVPSTQWVLARITRTYPGRDQLVRVVTVKTQSGEFKRPVTKLCLLPVNSSN